MALSEQEELELLRLKKRRSEMQAEVPPAPIEPPKPPKQPEFEAGKIPESTAYGGAAGFFMPEILKGTGRALQYSPVFPQVTRPLGVGMEVTGEALRGRRGASSVSGAVAGGAEESTMQLSKALGLPEPLQYGLALTAGATAPTLGGVLLRNNPITSQFLREAEAGGFKEAGRRFAERIRGSLPSNLREPQERVIARLSEEADRITQTGQQRANQIMSNAEAEIGRLLPGAETQAEQIRQRARDQAAATLFAARQQATNRAAEIRQIENRARQATQRFEGRVPQARQAIGQPAEVSDIGQSLRDRIVQVQGQRISNRTAQANADNAAVRSEVDAKQSQGQLVENLPEYKALLDEIKAKAGIGLKEPLKAERDPGTVSALTNLYNSLRTRQIEQNGAVVNLPTSFDAIDTIRRKLGEAFRNPQAEGYGAIGQNMAKDYYKRLSEILGKYSEAKKNLISNYEELSRELDIFKGVGRKATAIDRYDPTRFQTDPASLPAEYFSSRQSVRDLIDLTGGDRGLVEQQARAYIARQLQTAQDANQVRNFVDRNNDWLREFPQLQTQVNQFADQLGQTTRVTGRVGELQKGLRTELEALPKTLLQPAQKEAARITKAGEAEAKAAVGAVPGMRTEAGKTAREAQAQARREAGLLTSTQDPVVFFDKLVEEGFTPRFEAAARVIKTDPALMDDFVKGVQVSLSRVDPAQLPDKYARLIQPALLRAGLITEQQAKQIADQVRLVGMTADPRVLPIRTANLIKNAMAANLGALTTRGMESLGLSFTQPFLGGGNAANQGLQ